MKKQWITILLILSLVFSITGCQRAPAATKDGEEWSQDWVLVGSTLGVEPPGNGLTLLDNKDALAASNLYYASWSIGAHSDYENADGETVDLYDAQLYLLLMDCSTAEEAAANIEDWQSLQKENYQIATTKTITCAGEEFTLLIYDVNKEDNPYSRGISAFCVYGNHAINVELTCQDGFDGDEEDILIEFLNGFHYA